MNICVYFLLFFFLSFANSRLYNYQWNSVGYCITGVSISFSTLELHIHMLPKVIGLYCFDLISIDLAWGTRWHGQNCCYDWNNCSNWPVHCVILIWIKPFPQIIISGSYSVFTHSASVVYFTGRSFSLFLPLKHGSLCGRNMSWHKW